jgi:hypothetical protein
MVMNCMRDIALVSVLYILPVALDTAHDMRGITRDYARVFIISTTLSLSLCHLTPLKKRFRLQLRPS